MNLDSQLAYSISSSDYVFYVDVSDTLCHSLSEDVRFITEFDPVYHVWFIHHIAVDGKEFEDTDDCIDYLQYLFSSDMKMPSDIFIEEHFRQNRNSNIEWYRDSIEMRKELIKNGRLKKSICILQFLETKGRD